MEGERPRPKKYNPEMKKTKKLRREVRVKKKKKKGGVKGTGRERKQSKKKAL